MISCVVVFDGRVTRAVFDDTHPWLLASCVTWNLIRPRLWCWQMHFETTEHTQKWEDWYFVHFSVRWNWIIYYF